MHPPSNVLFLCTGNSARSIMAEALLTTLSAGRYVGYSAGSRPAGAVHPLAIELVAATGYPLERLRSKSWDEFGDAAAPQMDLVITVCDNAAGEPCPYWPGHPAQAHWGFADPAAAAGGAAAQRALFLQVYRQIEARIAAFLRLPPDPAPGALARQLQAIGKLPLTGTGPTC